MGVWLGPTSGKFKGESDFEFGGTYEFASDGSGNWEIALLNSDILKFKKTPGVVDIFMVGGGNPGGIGSATSNSDTGGAGGAGGECKTFLSISLTKNTNYTITIGQSGTPTSLVSSTTGTNLSANAGGNNNGGNGATVTNDTRTAVASAGGNGTYAFNTQTNRLLYSEVLFGAGGGGAEVVHQYNATYIYSNSSSHGGSNSGGLTGGGAGGKIEVPLYSGGAIRYTQATKGDSNTGAGGGGAYYFGPYGTNGQVGAGGSGIIIIRNHRESA